MPHSNGRAKFHSPRPSSGGELSPSDRSVKHASNHPRKTRQSVASHRLSPDVTVAPILPLTLTRPLLALAPPRKLLLPVLPLLLIRQMLIALNLSRMILLPLLRTTLADRNTSTNMSPPPRPHCNPRHRSRTPAPRPRNEAPTLHFPGPTPDVRKGAGTWHCHVNVIRKPRLTRYIIYIF
ncbi:hypothetical protein GWK47_039876 [Chionoecetes opilio]|uniref:Uncharacterized protein n=1 Tax=Chionoecetes opilio TaxID=41210 RepID=A0A8J4YJ14_CHIOP|nr:hypothetical protein GWK47_039876 [Chionoecetes opilio]